LPVQFPLLDTKPFECNTYVLSPPTAQFWCNRAPASPLEATLARVSTTVDSRPLTKTLSRLDATLTKKWGGGTTLSAVSLSPSIRSANAQQHSQLQCLLGFTSRFPGYRGVGVHAHTGWPTHPTIYPSHCALTWDRHPPPVAVCNLYLYRSPSIYGEFLQNPNSAPSKTFG
jgi:hypothetical protein